MKAALILRPLIAHSHEHVITNLQENGYYRIFIAHFAHSLKNLTSSFLGYVQRRMI